MCNEQFVLYIYRKTYAFNRVSIDPQNYPEKSKDVVFVFEVIPKKGTFISVRSPNRRTIIIFNPTQTNSNEPQPISTISLTSLNSFTNRFPNGSQHAPSAYRACITLTLSMLLTSFKIQPHVCTS